MDVRHTIEDRIARAEKMILIREQLEQLEISPDEFADMCDSGENPQHIEPSLVKKSKSQPLTIKSYSDDIVTIDGAGFSEEFYLHSEGKEQVCDLLLSTGAVVRFAFNSKDGWGASVLSGSGDGITIGKEYSDQLDDGTPDTESDFDVVATVSAPIAWVMQVPR